jgi:hypothetical protein
LSRERAIICGVAGGDIVVSDGYGQNWMHRFSATG